jgi:hypothetical protein
VSVLSKNKFPHRVHDDKHAVRKCIVPSSGSPKDLDELVRMLRHKYRISEGREWVTACVLSAEGTFGLPEDGAPAAPKHVGARLIILNI